MSHWHRLCLRQYENVCCSGKQFLVSWCMDADVKIHIDLRLAKGDFYKEEYLSTLHTLTHNGGGGSSQQFYRVVPIR